MSAPILSQINRTCFVVVPLGSTNTHVLTAGEMVRGVNKDGTIKKEMVVEWHQSLFHGTSSSDKAAKGAASQIFRAAEDVQDDPKFGVQRKQDIVICTSAGYLPQPSKMKPHSAKSLSKETIDKMNAEIKKHENHIRLGLDDTMDYAAVQKESEGRASAPKPLCSKTSGMVLLSELHKQAKSYLNKWDPTNIRKITKQDITDTIKSKIVIHAVIIVAAIAASIAAAFFLSFIVAGITGAVGVIAFVAELLVLSKIEANKRDVSGGAKVILEVRTRGNEFEGGTWAAAGVKELGKHHSSGRTFACLGDAGGRSAKILDKNGEILIEVKVSTNDLLMKNAKDGVPKETDLNEWVVEFVDAIERGVCANPEEAATFAGGMLIQFTGKVRDSLCYEAIKRLNNELTKRKGLATSALSNIDIHAELKSLPEEAKMQAIVTQAHFNRLMAR